MIVVTGAAGFIASGLVSKLNEYGYNELVLADDFSNPLKLKNVEGKDFHLKIDRNELLPWLIENQAQISFIFHLGARTDTTEFDKDLLRKLNYDYTKDLWDVSVEFGIPFLYASSAATYGLGEYGYSDSHDLPKKLKLIKVKA